MKLEQAIRSNGGNLARVAASLECSRPTLYKWIRQLGLSKLAGLPEAMADTLRGVEGTYRLPRVSSVDSVDGVATVNGPVVGVEYTKKYVKPNRDSRPMLVDVSATATTATSIPTPAGPKTQTTVRVDDALWRWARKFGVDRRMHGGDVVELALRRLRDQVEGKPEPEGGVE